MPLVSVCMITYNHEQFIEEAINAILMQKCNFDIELIISNDCATDKTHRVIQNILKKHPRASIINYIKHEKNIGMMPNFVFAYKKCKGKYIALCEGDDYWTDPLKLQKQVDFLDVNPEYVISCHDTCIVNEKGIKIKDSIFSNFHKKDCSKEQLINGAFLMPLTMCFRNVELEFPSEMFKVINADVFLISLLGEFGKSKFQKNILPASYRHHSNGVASMVSDLEKDFQRKVTFYQLFKYHYGNNNKKVSLVFYTKYRQTMLRLIKNKINNTSYIDSMKLYYHFMINSVRYGFWKGGIYLTVDVLKSLKYKK